MEKILLWLFLINDSKDRIDILMKFFKKILFFLKRNKIENYFNNKLSHFVLDTN